MSEEIDKTRKYLNEVIEPVEVRSTNQPMREGLTVNKGSSSNGSSKMHLRWGISFSEKANEGDGWKGCSKMKCFLT